MARSAVIDGWFTLTEEPALLAKQCRECFSVFFPPLREFCGNPICGSNALERVELSRRGTVWSYTDAQYQPPAPYIAPEGEYVPFGLAAVELPEGLVVLGQLADGYGVDDVTVGTEVELVVETLNRVDSDDLVIWRWKPVAVARAGSQVNA